MLKIILCLLPGLLVFTAPLHAAPPGESVEQLAVHALLLKCIPAITTLDPARIAEIESLPALPAAEQAALLNGQAGKVFALPGTEEKILLITYSIPVCSVAVRQLDPKTFIKSVDMWFGTTTPLTLMMDTTSPEGNLMRRYEGTMHGAPVKVTMNIRKKPVPNGVQAIMTAGTPARKLEE